MFIRVVAIALILALAPWMPVAAQTGTRVRVLVVDAGSAEPVADATVLSVGGDGPERVLGLTGNDGSLTVDLPSGAMIRAFQGSRRSAATPVLANTITITIGVSLVTIGMVQSRAQEPRVLSSSGLAAVVAGSLDAALRVSPTYRSATEGGTSSASVDGVPLPLPPSGTSSASTFSSDLFAGVDPQSADDSRVPDFHLLNPTKDLRVGALLTGESDDGARLQLSASGRRGRFGYGLIGVGAATAGPLHGATFRDSSGATYDHGLAQTRLGVSSKFTYNVAATSVTLSMLAERRRHADIAFDDAGDGVLSGIGPNNVTTSFDQSGWITLARTTGRDTLFLIAVQYHGSGVDSAGEAVLFGQPAPYHASYRYSGYYRQAKFTRTFGSLSIYGQAIFQSTAIAIADDGFQARPPASGLTTYKLGFDRSGSRGAFGASIGGSRTTGALGGGSPAFDSYATKLVGRTSVKIRLTTGMTEINRAASAASHVLSSPQTAQMTCGAATSMVTAPSLLTGESPHGATLSATVTRPSSNGAFTFGAFVARERHALVPEIDAGPQMLPPGYFATAAAAYSAACPASSLATVLFSRTIQVDQLTSKEGYAQYERSLGRHFSASGFYEVYSRNADGFATPAIRTTFAAGRQVLGVPLQRANVLVGYHNAKLQTAVDAYFESQNGSAQLPGHIELMAGAQLEMPGGVLSLSVQNPLGAYGGAVSSPRYAVFDASSGLAIPTHAAPIPTTWSIRYRLQLNRKVAAR